jgi:hypothetical protein
VAQGVFAEQPDGTLRFAPAPAPSDLDVARLLAAVRRRIVRLVARHGIDLEQPGNEADPADERLFESPVYAEIQGAAVVGPVATGPRAGHPPGVGRRQPCALRLNSDRKSYGALPCGG